MALVGRTGTGKSTMMLGMIASDANGPEGFALLDPHGDLAETAAGLIPAWRQRSAIHFNPADPGNQITFNPLEVPSPEQRHLVVADLIAIFNRIWERSWGPRLEYILRNVLMALTEKPGYVLLDALRLLNDKDFRKGLVAEIQDDIVRGFWEREFEKYTNSYRTEAIAPIQNKLGEFLVNPVLRRVFSDPHGSIRPRELMDGGGILIADLSVGKLGRDASLLLGAMLVGKFGLAALSRADVPIGERRDFYLYVDEFPSFATSSFSTILAEARKYRLALVVAMQYLEAIDQKLLAALLGNVGNLVVFRVSVKDAGLLAKELFPIFAPEDLVTLPYYRMYVKLIVDGKPTRPFNGMTILDGELRQNQAKPRIEPKTRRSNADGPAWEE
jgi:hypothetical protein